LLKPSARLEPSLFHPLALGGVVAGGQPLLSPEVCAAQRTARCGHFLAQRFVLFDPGRQCVVRLQYVHSQAFFLWDERVLSEVEATPLWQAAERAGFARSLPLALK